MDDLSCLLSPLRLKPDTSETRQAAGKADGRQSGLECIILPFFVGTQLAERSWLAAQAVSGYAAYNVRAERTVTGIKPCHFPAATSEVIFQPLVDLCCVVKGYWCVKW